MIFTTAPSDKVSFSTSDVALPIKDELGVTAFAVHTISSLSLPKSAKYSRYALIDPVPVPPSDRLNVILISE